MRSGTYSAAVTLGWLGLMTSLALVAAACGSVFEASPSDQNPDPTTVSASETNTDAGDEGSTDGEAPPVTTEGPAVADLPEWVDQELVLNTIAETEQPIALVGRSGTGDLYIATKTGLVQRITRTVSKNRPDQFGLDSRSVLDISDEVSSGNEQGLLDLVFSSDGRQLFVSYTDRGGANVIERYTMGSRTAQADSRREVLRLEQPFSNHNGGGLAFGPDGFLYVGLGDGGRSGDPLGSGQDADSLLGSIVRIDPDGAAGDDGYAVPNGNPYFDGGGAPEVWLTGARNPWRFSFDEPTGDLWIADVGQDRFEEVNRLPDGGRGVNLGWNLMEGFESFNNGREPDDHTPPFLAYAHENGRCSVTGGGVYRGEFLHRFEGVYIFGDFCSGETFGAIDSPGGVIFRTLNLRVDAETLGSFGVDNNGEMYLLSLSGPISRIEPTQATIDADEAAAEAEREAREAAEAEAEAEAQDG